MTNPPTIAESFRPALTYLEEVLRGIRAGRASVGLVEPLEVESYGQRMRLKEVGRISTPDARTIQIEPWDQTLVPAIEKAIAASPLGITPVTAGTVIRLPLPLLTEERRQKLTKLVRSAVEETKVSIRNTREKLLNNLKAQKDGGALSEDAQGRKRKKLQGDVDAAVAAAEAAGNAKEAEILSP